MPENRKSKGGGGGWRGELMGFSERSLKSKKEMYQLALNSLKK